jgi:hypothetical protein
MVFEPTFIFNSPHYNIYYRKIKIPDIIRDRINNKSIFFHPDYTVGSGI